MKYIVKIPLFLALFMCHQAALGQSDDIQSFTSSVRQDQYLTIVNPYIPNKISFAGQDIDFDNVDLYERLDRELTSMIYTHGNTLLTIKRANRYFPIIIPILKQYGLHSDFAYLACVESYLSPLAKSNVGAVGMWQFMPNTAKHYGLEVNDEVDERYDVVKETIAACKYIRNSFKIYGNWESVAASYNAGTGRISKELETQKQNSALNLWLVEETQRYPLRMIAMKMILENPKSYGFQLTPEQLYQPYVYKEIQVDTAIEDWPTWAEEQGIDYLTLRTHNPWIRAKKLTNKAGKSYTIKIPTKESTRRSTQKQKTYNINWVITQ